MSTESMARINGLDHTNGRVSFVSAREHAWHQLGEVAEDAMTAEEALEYGNLKDWNVWKEPLYAIVNGELIRATGRYGNMRHNPVVPGQVDFLGDVGESYTNVQNEQLAGLLNALVDESGAHFETAGALDGGSRVFFTMKMPEHILVGGVDPVDTYIAAMTSHDGSLSTSLFPTPVRVNCKNTLNIAFKNARNIYRVRHTVGAEKIMIEQARKALDFSFKFLDGFQEEAEQLINTTMTQIQFEELVSREFGAAPDAPAGTVTRSQNKIDQMVQLFADAGTQKGIRDTAWAGLNALTEWFDHCSPVRGVATATDETMVRSRKAVLDPTFKNQARELILSAV